MASLESPQQKSNNALASIVTMVMTAPAGRRQAALVLLFLLTLLLSVCLVASEQEEEQAVHVDDDNHHASSDDEAQHEDDDDGYFEVDHGLLVLKEVKDIPLALSPSLGDPLLLLTVVYSPTCSHSEELVEHVQQAAALMDDYFESISNDVVPPMFAKLDGTEVVESLKENLNVDSFPTLVLVRGQDATALIMEYIGLQSSSQEIFDTMLHYWYRYGLTQDCNIPLTRISDLREFLVNHGSGALRHVPPALNPNLSPEDQTHIRRLVGDEEESQQDPYVVIVHCRANHHDDDESMNAQYGELAEEMSGRRNVLFFSLSNCTGVLEDGGETSTENLVFSLCLSPPPLDDWSAWPDHVVKTNIMGDDLSLEHFVVQMATPPIMWYDFKSVAPIAFASYRKVHAVLFVDTRDSDISQVAISVLRRICRQHIGNMVCLVVPQTERRILTTFGIDYWTPLDRQVMDGAGPILPVMPTLLITDQRQSGTLLRYYLDSPTIWQSAESAIPEFIDKFWNNQLMPTPTTSSDEPRKNKSGVQILTANSWENFVQQTNHSLVYFFAPTCGHCKRFSVVWNHLARLVTAMNWNDFLTVAKMDVTQNEVMDIESVPDVYYMKNGSPPIRYQVTDEYGDGVGRLGNAMDLVLWFLDVSDLDEAKLLNEVAAQVFAG